MYPWEIRSTAQWLSNAGINDCAVARKLGIPRTTVRDWRRHQPRRRPLCPRCWKPTRQIAIEPDSYAELLGLYLGDGCISRLGRTYSLRLSLDSRYPGVICESRALMARIFRANRVNAITADRGSTTILCVYSCHLPCLFPQHGRGKKHERDVRLERWQQDLVDQAPWALLRGFIRSDGCVFVNRTGAYQYESYDFCNASEDLLDLFVQTCERVGVRYRRNDPRVRINRRESVAAMLEHVGRKG
jgi:hypothetical protein